MRTSSRFLALAFSVLLLGPAPMAMAEEPATGEPTVQPTAVPEPEPSVEPSDPVDQPTPDESGDEQPGPEQAPETTPNPDATTPPGPVGLSQTRIGPLLFQPMLLRTVTTNVELIDALTNCTDGDTVTVGDDITLANEVTVACDLTLDLAGSALTTATVTIAPGKRLTITDSGSGGSLTATAKVGSQRPGIGVGNAYLTIEAGTVTAVGEHFGAGIGTGAAEGLAVADITIKGGTVTATGNDFAAGIGGGNGAPGGKIRIEGGTVNAYGGGAGAGIGGGDNGSGGDIVISGGTVHAEGGIHGAGIGGGSERAADTIAITGGTITAIGGGSAAGIGGGAFADAGTITIANATVTATGGSDLWETGLVAAIGAGSGGGGGAITIGTGADVTVRAEAGAQVIGTADDPGFAPATVTIDGVLRAPEGPISTTNNAITISSAGTILGQTSDPTAGGSITGTGTIANGGIIALVDVESTVSITGHHYVVTASTGTVTVYGPSVQAGYRTFPSDPTPEGVDTLAGWDHQGTLITATTTLPGVSADGTPLAIDLEPTWNLGVAAFDPADITMVAGTAQTTTLTLRYGDGSPVTTNTSDWVITSADGMTLTPGNQDWQLTADAAGTGTVTAAITIGTRTYTATLDITVNAPTPDPETPTPTPDPETPAATPDSGNGGAGLPATGSTIPTWWLAAALALALMGGSALWRTRRS